MDVEADTRYHAQQDRSLRSSSTIYCLLMSSTLLYLPTTRHATAVERIPYVQNKSTVASMETKVETERFNEKDIEICQ